MDKTTSLLKQHYEKSFQDHGSTARGVDWGDTETANIRYKNMASLFSEETEVFSLLDVGCGYGAFYDFLMESNSSPSFSYTGIDVVKEMTDEALKVHPDVNFINGNIFDLSLTQKWDYLVCNGILTQKLNVSNNEMDSFACALIEQMFKLCNKGIAFNIMTTNVNFFSENLYYKSPLEMIGYTTMHLTKKFKLAHHYGLYEYTLYLYR